MSGLVRSPASVTTSLAVAGGVSAALLAAAALRVGTFAMAAAGLLLLAVALPGRRAAATALLLPLSLLPHAVDVGGLWASASDVLLVVLGAMLLVERAADRDRAPLLGPLTSVAVGFVVWTAASALWAADPTAPLIEAVQRFNFVILGVALIAALPRDGRLVRRTLVWFVAGSALLGAVTVGTGIAQSRYFGVYAAGIHKNTIGYLLSLGLLAAVALAVATPRRLPAARWLAPASLSILAGLVLAGSRGGWVGAIVALILVAALRRPDAAPAAVVAGAAAVALLLLVVPPDVAADRVGFTTPNSTADVRAQTWEDGVATIATAPLLGVGAGNFRAYVRDQGSQVDPNNLALLTWAETGIPGLLLLLALFGGCLRLAWRQVRRSPARGMPTAASLAGAGMLVAGVAHAQFDMFWSRGTALATFLGVGLVLWAHHSPADEAADAVEAEPADGLAFHGADR